MARKRARVTSVGGLGLSVGWEWTDTDAEIVRRLIVFLEDRRALAQSPLRADVGHVVESVLKIREELTSTLRELAPDSGASQAVRKLRDACLDFLDAASETPESGRDRGFVDALTELRNVFAVYVRVLAERHKIQVHPPLVHLLRKAEQADAGS